MCVSELPDPSWVLTKHSAQTAEGTISYTATAGYVPLKNEQGEVQAKMYFTAYTKEGDDARRPLTFCWNGGPGSSSIWLHMGAMAPRRAHQNSDATMAKGPAHIEDNDETWLPETDLVFVDPVGTGYSRVDKGSNNSYWGVDGDLSAMQSFIQNYLRLTSRRLSPIFLAGESYGTTRAAGLADRLHEAGIALSGIVLISSAVNFNIFLNGGGNELPFMVYLPSYTAIAAFHKKLSPEYNSSRDRAIADCEKFAIDEYWPALAKGDSLSLDERRALAHKLAGFSGVSADYWMRANLRLDPSEFEKQLLKAEGHTIGRNDARAIGTDTDGNSQQPEYDAADAAVDPIAITAFGDYVRNELGFKSELEYIPLNYGANGQWNWGRGLGAVVDQSNSLRAALNKNPYLKVLDCQGLYDLATPFFGSFYTMHHLGFNFGGRILMKTYEGGHMMYLNASARQKLHRDVAAFIKSQIG